MGGHSFNSLWSYNIGVPDKDGICADKYHYKLLSNNSHLDNYLRILGIEVFKLKNLETTIGSNQSSNKGLH